MAVINIKDVENMLKPDQTLAGLDLGSKTIGIAISDIGMRFANPRPVLHRRKFTRDADRLIEIMAHENVGVIVIGLPANMDGSEGPSVQTTRTFVANMGRITEIPFVFWDERLSTVAATKVLIGMDVSRKKRKQRIDSAAATFILQGALDRLFSLKGE